MSATNPLYDDTLIRDEELELSHQTAKELGYQENNLNAGYHYDPEELNTLHPFWKGGKVEPHTRKISFGSTSLSRDEYNMDLNEKTDFMERGERPLCKVVEVIRAAFGKRPIWKIVSPIKDKFILHAMDIIFNDIIETLKSGKTYYANNSSSLRVKSGAFSIMTLEKAYITFRYIAGFPPLLIEPVQVKTVSQLNREKLARLKEELLLLKKEKDQKEKENQSPETSSKPRLVRQASRSVYCSY
jgi:hypothetical protein